MNLRSHVALDPERRRERAHQRAVALQPVALELLAGEVRGARETEGQLDHAWPRVPPPKVGAGWPSISTFTQAGRPAASARASAGASSSGRRTSSPWQPSAAASAS